jgi:hypothetical protein
MTYIIRVLVALGLGRPGATAYGAAPSVAIRGEPS